MGLAWRIHRAVTLYPRTSHHLGNPIISLILWKTTKRYKIQRILLNLEALEQILAAINGKKLTRKNLPNSNMLTTYVFRRVNRLQISNLGSTFPSKRRRLPEKRLLNSLKMSLNLESKFKNPRMSSFLKKMKQLMRLTIIGRTKTSNKISKTKVWTKMTNLKSKATIYNSCLTNMTTLQTSCKKSRTW